jgi:predicted O-methyltransferase YrrM
MSDGAVREDLRRLLAEVPFTDPDLGPVLHEFVRRAGVRDALELGTGHGASACWLAGAGARVTTIDRSAPSGPAAGELLARTGLAAQVRVVRARRSYTWELMRLIDERTAGDACRPAFDLCLVDGEHTWDTDGLAFFLVEKLLLPGGWVVFDDLDWTFATSPSLRDSELVRGLPEEERRTPQVERVFRLLVRQHPAFGGLRVHGKHGWARKAGPGAAGPDLVDEVYAAVRQAPC